MRKNQNSIGAILLKSKNVEDVLKHVRIGYTSLSDMTLALRTITNHLKYQYKKDTPWLQEILALQEHVLHNFDHLKSRDICNVIFSLKLFHEMEASKFFYKFDEIKHLRILEIMNNPSVSPGHAFQIYHDLHFINQFKENYDRTVLALLSDENNPLSLMDIKLVMITVSEKISFMNNQIIQACYKLLNEYIFTIPMIIDIITLLRLIRIIESRLNTKDSKGIIEKIIKFLESNDLSLQHLESLFEILNYRPNDIEIFKVLSNKILKIITNDQIIISNNLLIYILNALDYFKCIDDSHKNILL